MKRLLASTEDFIKDERGRLSADVAAGSNIAVPVDSSEGVSTGDYIVFGVEGSEFAELCTVASTTDTSITVDALKFTHRANDPFVIYRFNQRKFYGAATAAGPFTELTDDGSPKDILVDDQQGALLEYSGTDYSYFKATYFNSTTNAETDTADSTAVSGDESARYCSIYAIRRKAGLTTNPFITDDRLENKRKQAENEINSALYAVYRLPLSEVPPLISQIAELLAAGYIDFEEFGAEGEGVKWLGEGRAILKQITAGTRRLLGSDFTELTRINNSNSLNGYPDSSEPDGPIFSMSDKF